MPTTLLVVSLVVQLLAAGQALRLIRITGRRSAWVLIAAAVLLMTMRRLVTLVDVWAGREVLDPQAEMIALGVSLLMLGGISLIAPLFRSIERSRRELTESEARYAALIRDSPDGIIVVAHDGLVEAFNPEAARITGVEAGDVLGCDLQAAGFLVGPHLERFDGALAEARTDRRAGPIEVDVSGSDGTIVPVEVTLHRVEGKVPRVKISMRDISERRQALETSAALEQQLQEARRLEALGRLAGGVAHDFNNLLTVILGSCELVLRNDGLPAGLRPDLEASCEAAKRAANLTRQLLAFGRRQVLQAEEVDLNQVVLGLEDLLSRVVGENVQLEIDCAAGNAVVLVDPAQMDQVVLNLVTNARDAMPDGGVLKVRTDNLEVDVEQSRVRRIGEGPYVALSVSDSGQGMDAETRERLFEPFFTTKELGKGSGLGLATVHGIVKQSSGHVEVDSEPGRGTTLRVLLPRVIGKARLRTPPHVSAAIVPHGTVLLVEDEPAVRSVLGRGLVAAGFDVLVADDAAQALEQCEKAKGRIDAMVTDVVMPGGSGSELASSVAKLFPQIRIVLMSGYTADALDEDAVAVSAAILQKPFSSRQLAERVQALLAEQQHEGEDRPRRADRPVVAKT